MTTYPIFMGAATALITPMTEEGVDYEAFGKLMTGRLRRGSTPW